jgi:hypothetical protein
MFGNKKTYDFIFSIGGTCSCSRVLRRTGLQVFSYPFDWLYGSDFVGRVDILTSGFENFINLEDLGYARKRIHPGPADIYHNKINNITFNHDFPLDIPIEKSYPEVKAKYDKRINRLFEQIKKSEKILIAYIEPPRSQNKLQDNNMLNNMLIESYKKLSERFPDKQIDLIYTTNCEEKKINDICTENISNNITKIILNYKKLKKNKKLRTNWKILSKIFRRYKLKLTTKQKLLNIIQVKILRRYRGDSRR